MKYPLLFLLILFHSLLYAQHSEYLEFDWMKMEGWKIGFQQETEKMLIIEYIPEKQSIDTWREIGTIQMIKMDNVRNFTPKQMMEFMHKQGLDKAPKAKLTYIAQNDSIDYPWIQFKIEAPEILDNPNSESQLYHMIQGKETLFVIIWGIRRWEIYEEELNKWTKILLKAKVGIEE